MNSLCFVMLKLLNCFFSQKGKIFEYSSDSVWNRFLNDMRDTHMQRDVCLQIIWNHRCRKTGAWNILNSRLGLISSKENYKHYMGEDLDSMSLKDLQNLEQQLDTALKLIRSRKNQLMHESISEL
ncbi:Transcription factor [Datura stramonium]|uniref:Transcription factor n=1 Tax=Datura stramonium TaxID=4076 RepID=A0ABS8S520_DATST|nr:Transcription factor [Datura stramonium]